MLMRIVDLFERMVVALEKMAAVQTGAYSFPDSAFRGAEEVKALRDRIAAAGVQAEEKKEIASLDTSPGAGTLAPETGNANVGTATAGALDRDAIKNALLAKGISFKASARTETLQKMLEEANKAEMGKSLATAAASMSTEGMTTNLPPAATPPADDPFATEATPPAAATKEQARDYLVAYSAKAGKDNALAMLKTVGKAEKLSDVDPAYYAAIVAECKKQGTEVA